MTDTAFDLMRTDFPVIDADMPVLVAERQLQRHDSLVVINRDGTVFGVVTSRHVIDFYRRPLNDPRATQVWEVCNARPRKMSGAASARVVLDELERNGGEPLLVLDKENRLLGALDANTVVGDTPAIAPIHRFPATISHWLH